MYTYIYIYSIYHFSVYLKHYKVNYTLTLNFLILKTIKKAAISIS